MAREFKFDLNVGANALLCPNPEEYYSKAYVVPAFEDNVRMLPNVKYKTKLASNTFDRVLYPSTCNFTNIADSSLDAIDIDICSMSVLTEMCQFDMEQAFFSNMITSGSNHCDFIEAKFKEQYFMSLAAKVNEEIALLAWQGDTDLVIADTFLANCDGWEKKLAADTDVLTPTTAAVAVTKSNVVDKISDVYNTLPAKVRAKNEEVRLYASSNVVSAYLEAVAENNTILYTTMNPELTYLGRIKIVEMNGMSDNTMVFTRKSNMIYAFDAVSDKDEVRLIDMKESVGEPTYRTRTDLKAFFTYVNPEEIVFYQPA